MTEVMIPGGVSVDERSKRRRSIAYRLLIELLTCQFAYPVRWIETQDVLFLDERNYSRFIEIGPARLLTGMAKQTRDVKHADRDLARSIHRKFLFSGSEEREICYDYDPADESSSAPSSQSEPLPFVARAEIAMPQQPTSASSSVSSAASAATPLPDAPVSAQEIITCLVARKLNRAFDEIPTAKSIRELTGGKSTLQNELIGILESEFSSLPPAPEDAPISLLSEEIQRNFSGNVGKESSRLLARLFSTQMPAGFSQNDLRNYLESTWGVGKGRQTSILLLATTAELKVRLPSVDAAKSFFESIIARYSSIYEVDLNVGKVLGGQQGPEIAVVDTKQMERFHDKQNGYLTEQFNILADHLGVDLGRVSEKEKSGSLEQEQRSKLELWSSEFEDDFEDGIQPAFDTLKERHFNSWWNNVRLDVITLFYGILSRTAPIDEITLDAKILHIANRSDDFVCKLVGYLVDSISEHSSSEASEFRAVAQKLSTAFVSAKSEDPVFKYTLRTIAPETTVSDVGIIQYKDILRDGDGSQSYPRLLRNNFDLGKAGQSRPFVDIQSRYGNEWLFDANKTETLLRAFDKGTSSGISFAGKDILITGAGPKSIGSEVLRGLLLGGARVIVTSSRPPSETKQFFQDLYAECGARGSDLTVLPFNQGNKHDCTSLIDHIYSEAGLGRNLDAIIPFAAISERAEIDGISSRSELAHRLMLVNFLRMLGDIVRNKNDRNINTRPTQVLVPLSPNHGIFGGDGLYAESKLGLEGLLSRFYSETWSDYLHICGAVIGWTRGTELMGDNDTLAQAIESQHGLTFSRKEMAFNLLTLMTEPVTQMCERESILVNLNGSLNNVPDLKKLLLQTRDDLNQISDIRKAIAAEDELEKQANEDGIPSEDNQTQPVKSSTINIGYPNLPHYERDVEPLHHLEGMVDVSSVPVIVGFSELGPWGSARTRWEMESRGKFSQEGYVEMAWMMNIIKHFRGEKDGKPYAGWVDTKTGEKIHDSQVGELYGRQILEHSGVRIVEPELLGGYDPNKKEYLHEVAIKENLPEFEASPATAEALRLQHGDKISIRPIEGSEDFKVQLKQGAVMMVPKAVPFEGSVAGQIPTGWDPTKYGLPEDIVRQVDPVTAYALCCAAEALYSAGISDANELLQHFHVSEIGNFVGSMMGGITKLRNMYKDRYMDKDVQGDVMQETYLNTSAAWINMLLLGAAGPIKTPAGACATGIESIDSACESLLSGKTKICFAGGTDDFQEEESYAFRTMNATVNANMEFAKGRVPSEMSRPTSDSRAGFVESQGSGIQIITTADIALSLGLPIYGVIAGSAMAGDKISRSVPAPGQGILSFARQTPQASQSPLLDLEYRRREMRAAINRAQKRGMSSIREAYRNANKHTQFVRDLKMAASTEDGRRENGNSISPAISAINRATDAQTEEIKRLWGNDFRRLNPDISPLQASLATWGLTVDDIGFASLHATSTQANDKNEPEIINKEMSFLKRTLGNPLLAICQKSITGHPKAPAATFMLNGCLQALNTGLVPGNRNADNVDPVLSNFPHITFPTRSIQTGGLKAFSLTCFGFGQKGGQLIGVHPRFLYGTIDRAAYDSYATRVVERTRHCNSAYLYAMIENRIIACREVPQYAPADQDAVLLNTRSRIRAQPPEGEPWRYVPSDWEPDQLDTDPAGEAPSSVSSPQGSALSLSDTSTSTTSSSSSLSSEMIGAKAWLEDAAARVPKDQTVSVGIDVEDVSSMVNLDLHGTFAQRNYTEEERSAALHSVDQQRSMTGKWSAKEAVFKSLGVESKGAGAAMKDIEIVAGKEGAPVVKVSCAEAIKPLSA